MVTFCDWCLFYKDMVTFSADFNKIHLCSTIFKLVDAYDLSFRIINYYCFVNEKVVDDCFSPLPTFNQARL